MKKIRILLPLLIWCASCGAAFYVGRVSIDREAAEATARQAAGQGAVRTQIIAGNNNSAANQPVPADFNLQDILNGTGRLDRNLLERWADSLDPAQLASLIGDLQKLPAGERRDDVIEEIVDSWSRRDPQGFLTARGDVSNPRTRENGVADALRSLAEVDPKFAMSWLAASTDVVPNDLLARRYRETLEGIAEKDPVAALDYIKQLGSTSELDQQIKRQGLNAVADRLAEDGHYTDAMQVFATLSPEDRNAASGRLLGRWADDAPDTASTYVATIQDPAMRTQMAERVAQSWARNDPQAAAVWAAGFEQSQGTGQPSGQILAEAIRAWTRYDLNGPAQFLNTLPHSAATDQAVTTFTMQARNIDPASAMNWANLITDPTTRQRVSSAVALQWLATDPGGFNQNAANLNGFTDQQKQMLNNLSQNPELLNRINQRINQDGLDSMRWLGGGNRGQNNGANGTGATR